MPFFRSYAPPPVLRPILRELEIYHACWDKENDLPEPFITCLANTEQNLYLYPHDPISLVPDKGISIPVAPAVVTGPKSKPVGLRFGRDHLMIKAGFHPTGTFRLFKIDMQLLVNAGMDAVLLWGRHLEELLAQVRNEPDYDAIARMVFTFISHQFDQAARPEEPIDNVAIFMQSSSDEYSQEALAAMACLSPRQFERNFLFRVGMLPKLFSRIVRFENAMKVKNDSPQKNWREIALECGYTDSSHLLRDFREFAEFPPGNLFLNPTSGFSSFPTG